MGRLSLANRDLAPLAGRLILVHGRRDPLIPSSESMARARAVPCSALFLIDGFSHNPPESVGWAAQLPHVRPITAGLATPASRTLSHTHKLGGKLPRHTPN